MKHIHLFAITLALGLGISLQSGAQAALAIEPASSPSTYRVIEISRSIEAVNYGHRNGATDVDFAGTALMSSSDGKAKVRSKRGTMEVEAEFGSLQPPTTFGGEYLTYVLWAISPEGKPANLGEVLVGDNARSKLTATTDLQSFALIVTAEPYYAVQEPSNVVVLENMVRAESKAAMDTTTVKYDLLERGGYIPTGYVFDPVLINASLPLEFYEARNALRIAKSEGAEKYAAAGYQRAKEMMDSANALAIDKHIDRKALIAASRETVQASEASREIAVKQIGLEMLAINHQLSLDAQNAALDSAHDADLLKAKAQADAASAQAEAATAKADLAASQAASATAISAAQADAEQARLAAQAAQASANQANTDKAAMRAQLIEKLNSILATRDSARGLIVSMSDVLFDSGQFTLKPGSREKLAKVAGILIAYPGLNIAVGGYTDNVGGDAMNQKLSENRAGAVLSYLVEQGVSANSVSATGYGNAQPVATNTTAAGRQENRRVELVVSGYLIGSPANTTTGSLL